jgi:tetratricopeptide (TPR) repeat protein
VYLQKSLSIFEELGSKGFAFQVLRDLGHAARALKEYDQAEVYYENCVILAQEIGWSLALPGIYWCLGFVALHRSNVVRARKYFNQAEELAQESNFSKSQV